MIERTQLELEQRRWWRRVRTRLYMGFILMLFSCACIYMMEPYEYEGTCTCQVHMLLHVITQCLHTPSFFLRIF